MKSIPALIGAIFFALSCFVPQAWAASPAVGSLTVSPAYLEVSLTKPGEVQAIPITYTNHSQQAVTLTMFALDFNQADANGTIGFLPSPGSYSYSLASFLSLEASEITIEPNEKKTFTAVVTNRPDLTPGGHYAGIIGKIESGPTRELGANVSPSLSSLIFLRKTGGERYNLSLNRTDRKESVTLFYPETVNLQFQNEGNVHLVPYGTAVITDSFGRVIRRGVLNTSSFLVMPESQRNITVSLRPEQWSYPVSFNTLTVHGNDSLHKTTFLYRNSFLYIHPMVLFLPVLLLGGFWLVKKRRKQKSKKREQVVVKKPVEKPKSPRRRRKKT
jgi:hypothetical protein